MEDEAFENPLLDCAKRNWLILALLIGGILLIGIGLKQMTGQKTASVKFEKATKVTEASDTSSTKIKVDVEGQVEKPGVYSLNPDAFLQQL